MMDYCSLDQLRKFVRQRCAWWGLGLQVSRYISSADSEWMTQWVSWACRGRLSEEHARWFFKQLILAIDYWWALVVAQKLRSKATDSCSCLLTAPHVLLWQPRKGHCKPRH